VVDFRLFVLEVTFESVAVVDVPLLLQSEDDREDKPESSTPDDVAPLPSTFPVVTAPFLAIWPLILEEGFVSCAMSSAEVFPPS